MNKIENGLLIFVLYIITVQYKEIENQHIRMTTPPIELSPEQSYALAKFKLRENLFITGAGGTGKTRLIQYFIEHANLMNKKIQVCALTGCAALLLGCNAKTIHSWSGIKLARGSSEKIIDSVLKNKYSIANWKKIHILVIDEVSMMSKKIFEILDKIGRAVRHNYYKPFGGIQVICTGDFCQLPPVPTVGDPDTEMFCFESERWNETFSWENHIILKTMFRQKDPIYVDVLLKIRDGTLDEVGMELLKRRVGVEYNSDEHNGCIPIKLYPTRNKVDYMNETMFEKIDDVEYHFNYSFNTDCKCWLDNLQPLTVEEVELGKKLTEKDKETEIEFLIRNTPCTPLLKLKKGAAVICTVNLNLEQNICNGSQGIVVDIIDKNGVFAPVVKFANGSLHTFQPHHWQSEDYPTISIFQYPLCLAWAMTIHKMQGATLDMAEMDIGKSIFEYGQTYVALSRIKALDGLYLTAFNPEKIKTNPKVVAFYANIPDIPLSGDGVKLSAATPADFSKYALKEEDYVDSNLSNVKINKTTTKNVVVSSHNCSNNNSFGVIKKV